jgi:DNA-damage-inducible protein J
MPTIQFRTDDHTKTASQTLFNQLGITMSEAINLFLRQSVMRGGIPFTLNVPRAQTAVIETPDDETLIAALRRYKAVNNKSDFDITKAEPFLQAIRALRAQNKARLTFYEDAVKVRLDYAGREYVIDYNFDEPDNVFIVSRKDGKLFVKDCNLAGISKTLELF